MKPKACMPCGSTNLSNRKCKDCGWTFKPRSEKVKEHDRQRRLRFLQRKAAERAERAERQKEQQP